MTSSNPATSSVSPADESTTDGGAGNTGAFAIRTVAVIGAGEQGRAFALRCARAGIKTILEDVMPAKLRRAREELGSLESPERETAALLSFALTVEDAVRDADLAIDFVPDELESKLEIFSLMDRMAPPKTIFCTPTNVLSISDLASCTYRADRCVAVHSAGKKPLEGTLRLVPGGKVGEALIGTVQTWLESLGYSVSAGHDLVAV